MNFLASRRAPGSRYDHLTSLIPGRGAKKRGEEEETRRAGEVDETDPDGKERNPKGDPEPRAEDDGEVNGKGGKKKPGDEEEGDRPGGEAANRGGNEERDHGAGDGEDEEDDEEDDEEEDEDDEDEEEMKRCEAGGFGRALRAARRAERKRVRTIFTSQASAGRVAAAAYLACETNLSAKKAIGLLAASPIGAAGGKSLRDRMAEQPRRSVGSDHAPAARQTPGQSLVAAAKRLVGQSDPDDPINRLAGALADRISAR